MNKSKNQPPPLYKQHYIDKNYECTDLYRKIAEKFAMKNALYAGSFVHIAPSFVIPEVVYVDSDRRFGKFFETTQVLEYIESHKEYPDRATIRFHHQSYEKPIEESKDYFDLLISQYAGFVSLACKKYLKVGGYLLANNSHGDAGVANLDADFEFVAAVNNRSGKYSLRETNLNEYFVPKKEKRTNVEDLLELGRGLGYTKTAYMYLFRRIS